jgi:MFS family permease
MTRLPFPASMAALVLEGLLSRLSFGLISFALPLYARHLGFSLSEVGLLVSLNTAVSLALKPATGLLADRVGLKRTLLAGIGLRSVVSGLLIAAAAPWHLYAIRGLHGLSMSLRDPSVTALIAEHGGEKQVASAFAWYQSAKTLAGQLSKGLAGFLLALTGAHFGLVFLVAFGLSVLPALLVALAVKRDHPETPAPAPTAPLAPAATPSRGAPAARPSVIPFMTLGLLIRGTADMLDGLVPIIATEYAGLTVAQTGLVFTVGGVALIVAGPVFGWLADHVSNGLVLSIRGAANALSSAVYVLAPGFPGVLTAKTIDDIGKAAYRPAWGALMARVSSADRRSRARTIGFMTTGEDLGSVLAPVLAGFLWSTWGLAVAMGARVTLALITEVYAVALARPRASVPRTGQRPPRPTAAPRIARRAPSEPTEDEMAEAEAGGRGRAPAFGAAAVVAGGAALLASAAFAASLFLSQRQPASGAEAGRARAGGGGAREAGADGAGSTYGGDAGSPGNEARAPAAVAIDSLQRALEAYHLRATLFTTRKMTCADLGRGMVEIDAQWMQYNLARSRTVSEDFSDSAHARDQALAHAVEQVEADFERTGCPRP